MADRGAFPSTWTVVLAHRQSARAALEALCSAYWYPIYAFIRRKGSSPEDALDLTQGFFTTQLIEKASLASYDPERGRFRAWLLGAVKNYLRDQRDRANAAMRNPGPPLLSLDALIAVDGEHAERQYRFEPGHDVTPERVYHRRWALLILDRAFERLRAREESEGEPGDGEFARTARAFLAPREGDASEYRRLGEQFGLSEGAVKTRISRLRERFGDALCAEIEDTVEDPSAVDKELRFLLEALSEPGSSPSPWATPA